MDIDTNIEHLKELTKKYHDRCLHIIGSYQILEQSIRHPDISKKLQKSREGLVLDHLLRLTTRDLIIFISSATETSKTSVTTKIFELLQEVDIVENLSNCAASRFPEISRQEKKQQAETRIQRVIEEFETLRKDPEVAWIRVQRTEDIVHILASPSRDRCAPAIKAQGIITVTYTSLFKKTRLLIDLINELYEIAHDASFAMNFAYKDWERDSKIFFDNLPNFFEERIKRVRKKYEQA